VRCLRKPDQPGDNSTLGFFVAALAHTSLENYYIECFELKEYRDGGVWTLMELDDMFPFERAIYIAMTQQRVAARAEQAKQS
jgi:hypothetical protein